jgi:hypothetical protein
MSHALYGLLCSGHQHNKFIADSMRTLDFIASTTDRNVWTKLDADRNCYSYVPFYPSTLTTTTTSVPIPTRPRSS